MKLFFSPLLLIAALFICGESYGMRQAIGQYVGTGAASRAVTGFGFQPEVILVKPASTASAFIATSTMAAGKTKVLDPADVLKSNYVKTIDADGFTAGTSANTLGRTYYFVAFDDDADLNVGTFTGSTSSQSINVGYRPAMVWVLGEVGDWNDYGNISQDGWDSSPDAFNNGSILDASSSSMSSYYASGFTVPASATSGVDDGAIYNYVTFKNSNVYTGTFSGNGGSQSINIGVTPDLVIVKNTSDLTNNVWFKTYAMPATASYKFVDDVSTIAINGFSGNNFSVGVQGEVNGTGNTLQYFALGTPTGTLPVNIVYFIGSKKENTIALNWQTGSEINSEYFTVERSSDGVHFETIAITDAAGNSNSLLNYSFEDEHPLSGNNYYRLKESDNDGQVAYFKTVVVNFTEGNSMVVVLYPNPASNETTLSLNNNQSNTIVITDALGNIIREINTAQDLSSYKINTADLAQGTYYINGLNKEGINFYEKLVVIK